VPGGGTALLRAETALDDLELDGDYAIGADLVRRVLAEPLVCSRSYPHSRYGAARDAVAGRTLYSHQS
jgi:hypothetical protein